MKRTAWLILFLLCFFCSKAWCQQDINFTISNQFFAGKKIIKVKKDFNDPYVWVLGANNEVYRINSVDQTISDYTSTFSSYNTLQFVDIAGRSSDSVFIATNSPNFIQYANGNSQLMGSNVGITDTVTSIGMDYSDNNYNVFHRTGLNNDNLLIGTVAGTYGYNINTGANAFLESQKYYGKVYEATYRAAIFCGYYLYDPKGDTVLYHETTFENPPNSVGYWVWQSAHKFGININTTYLLTNVFYYQLNNSDYTSELWGSEKGLFQINANFSNSDAEPYNLYLSNINITKITSILGLTTFGNISDPNATGFIRNNLLVGTSEGFYYSTSVFNKVYQNNNTKYTFTQYAPLGNQPINDIFVNNASINPICENGVWVATDNGLYYLTPSYANSLISQQLNAVSFKNQAQAVTSIQICAGSNATAVVNFSGNTIQWYKNGTEIPGAIVDTLQITSAGEYYATLLNPCLNQKVESNHDTVSVVAAPTFTFNYPSTIQNCNTNPVPLTVTGDPSYQYRWYTNGVLNGNTTQSFSVTQSGQYYVEVSACPNSWVPSGMVQVTLVNLPAPAITGDKPTYCQGDAATLSAGVPLDQSYTINWFKDGTLLSTYQNFPAITVTDPGSYTVTLNATGSTCSQSSAAFPLSFTPPPTFSFNYPASVSYCAGSAAVLQVQGSAAYQYQWYSNSTAIAGATTNRLSITQAGSYNVQVSSCPGSWVPSSTVAVNFIQTPVPAISTDKPAYCAGDNATLSANIVPDPTYTVNWYCNNVLLPQFNGYFSITTNISGTYTAAVVGNTPDANGNICSSLSAPVVIGFDPAQVISIQQIANNGLCQGQSVTLKAIYNSGTIQWSTGETTDDINVTTSGTYTVTLTTPSGCTANSSQTVNFLPLPVLNVPGAAVCFYKNETATLTAPAGFSQYSWDNKTSGQTYVVTKPETVTLIVTDANGCQATQKIAVTDLCPEVEIPNTFTPNGDNINDTWVIQGLDDNAVVQIFNRYGALLYKSVGYTTPWDGTYHGKKVPSGAYYYIITTKSGNKKYSGSLMIIY